ncbi:MAG: HAD family hydrolase [Acidobacteriota bacterium]|nr:HAD family hydrolase [Acidobacteriota bacterium]
MGIAEVTPRRAVFLDRDGVINEPVIRDGKPYPPATVDELKLIAGVQDALSRLDELGFLLLVVTNQPDVARGAQTREAVTQMHARLSASLPIRGFMVCFHDNADNCSCRKPLPGLILEAAGKYGIDVQKSYLIGDRWRDIDAGWAAGCKTILIDYGYRERGPTHSPDKLVANLSQAVEWITWDMLKLVPNQTRSSTPPR